MKNIIALALVAIFFALASLVAGITTPAFAIALTLTAYLFVGERYWAQTVADMRRSFDDPDNTRMLTQLSMRSWSMLLPMITTMLFWPVFMILAMILAASLDHAEGPLTAIQHR